MSLEQIELTINKIKYQLRATGEREIQTRAVGELVMEALRDLDEVAYVRFASVYRKFQDVNEFRREIEKMGKKSVKRKNR